MPSFTVFSGSPSGEVVQKNISKPDLTGDQILIRITVSGLCGTDLHSRHIDKCLGHEGVGRVEAVGPDTRLFKVGSRAGFGYLRNSCGQCKECLSGHEIFCPERDTYARPSDIGSLASHAIWRESYAFEIPESMSDEDAAALMCGGATVFSALTLYDVAPTESIGIVGIGGLGHLAIQFAAKMGCDVTVFSGSTNKEEEALSLGAHHFVASRGVEKLDLGGRKIDRLLVTASAQPGEPAEPALFYFHGLTNTARLEPLHPHHGTSIHHFPHERLKGEPLHALRTAHR
jgi:D-arabinose 1-dehydrogenase-like Zn-dependent alcohol dehydrogenase